MKNFELAEKVKTLRQSAGLSQDALAEAAGLNLRTIQRIESGDTTPRGDTLVRLANALNKVPSELIAPIETVVNNNRALIWINLSALGIYIFPLFGIIFPLLVASFQKDKGKSIDTFKARLLNFQITWCILYLTVLVLAFTNISTPSGLGVGRVELMLLSIVALYGFNFIMVIINTFRLQYNKPVFYQPAIPILR
jgi:transcriptional regulator with XRE-family HTH domain